MGWHGPQPPPGYSRTLLVWRCNFKTGITGLGCEGGGEEGLNSPWRCKKERASAKHKKYNFTVECSEFEPFSIRRGCRSLRCCMGQGAGQQLRHRHGADHCSEEIATGTAASSDSSELLGSLRHSEHQPPCLGPSILNKPVCPQLGHPAQSTEMARAPSPIQDFLLKRFPLNANNPSEQTLRIPTAALALQPWGGSQLKPISAGRGPGQKRLTGTLPPSVTPLRDIQVCRDFAWSWWRSGGCWFLI